MPPSPHGRRARGVVVANNKGGVGKTTTTIHLARSFAARGLRVLAVDVDHQANLTMYFLGLAGKAGFAGDLHSIINGDTTTKAAIVATSDDRLWLLPATNRLALLDVRLVLMHRREAKVNDALEPVRGDYDLILYDCPPAWSQLAVAAHVAADDLLTPIDAGQFAAYSLQEYLGQVGQFRNEQLITATHLGVLLTKVDPRTRMWQDVLAAVAERWPTFQTQIPARVGWERQVAAAAAAATLNGEPAPEITRAYELVAEEILARWAAAGLQVGPTGRRR